MAASCRRDSCARYHRLFDRDHDYRMPSERMFRGGTKEVEESFVSMEW